MRVSRRIGRSSARQRSSTHSFSPASRRFEPWRAIARLRADQDGSGAVMSVIWLCGFITLLGVAVDVANAYRVRAQLQATADASALAAVLRIDSPDDARAAAQQLARINMPADHNGEVMPAALIELGVWEAASGQFVQLGLPPYNAVRVTAKRGDEGGFVVPTFLLGLMSADSWTIAASSIAMAKPTAGGAGGNLCGGGLIMSENTMQMGGNDDLADGICIHGELGVHFGGSSFFTDDVRVSAYDPNTIEIGHVDNGSAGEAEVKVDESVHLEAKVLPKLNTMFEDLWAALYDSGVTTYSGPLIPEFIYNASGYANVVRINQWWWTVQPGDLQPHTIYMVNHGMQLAGGVDAQNVAIIAKGQIGMGGGPALHFDKVMMFGEGTLNFSGDVSYGEQDHFCDDGEYDVYLFSKDTISLGGWGGSSWTHAFMAVAPTFSPGGAMKNAGGIYVEARNTIQMGGNIILAGCDNDMAGHYETIVVEGEHQVTYGASLVR